MINREQLIKALEYCTADECNPDCPYYEVDVGCRTQIEIDALTLLEEQAKIIDLYHKADAFLNAHGWKWE